MSKVSLFIAGFAFVSGTAHAVILRGLEESGAQKPATFTVQQCEEVLAGLEKQSGLKIQNPVIRQRLLHLLETQPEAVLLNLMAVRASSGSCDTSSIDSAIDATIAQMEAEESTPVLANSPQRPRSQSGSLFKY
jgi:hypothetical protein